MNPNDPRPQLYLITPHIKDAEAGAAALASALGIADVAAVLLRLADADERTLINRVKTIAPAAQSKGVALILDGQPDIVARCGADGAHLSDPQALKAALPNLKPDRIAGCGGLKSRHDAMFAGETGADYVMFGEPDAQGSRPSFEAILDRVGWWAGLFEIPCVAYAASLNEVDELVKAHAEFIAVGDLVFADPRGPTTAITEIAARLVAPEAIS
jgi:thiamine-phosphate pyrophosphorylase